MNYERQRGRFAEHAAHIFVAVSANPRGHSCHPLVTQRPVDSEYRKSFLKAAARALYGFSSQKATAAANFTGCSAAILRQAAHRYKKRH